MKNINVNIYCNVLFIGLFSALYASMSQEQAMNIAEQEISIMNSITTTATWGAGAAVTTAYPLYLDGIEGVSYWECKVMKNGNPAGYIVVNANKTDLLLPESCPAGLCATEELAAKMSLAGIKIYRYGPVKYLAVNTAINKIVAEKNLRIDTQSTAGMDFVVLVNQSDFSACSTITGFRAAVISKKCYPTLTIEQLNEAYETVDERDMVTPVSRQVYLKNYLTGYSSEYYTPRWYQIKIGDGYAIGCANTAWAIVYGYWRRYKGKDKLFDGLQLTDAIWTTKNGSTTEQVSQCMKDCFIYCNTTGICFNHNGLTLPGDLPNGIKYAVNKGYEINSRCQKLDLGPDEDFNDIFNELTNDRPVIILLATGETHFLKDIADHYVVIEGAIEEKGHIVQPEGVPYMGGALDYCKRRFLVNWGNCGISRWITGYDYDLYCHYNITIGDYSEFSIAINKKNATAPCEISFSPINGTGKVLNRFIWNFGDGGSEEIGQTASHIFRKPGTYTVTLKGYFVQPPSYYIQYLYTASKVIRVNADLTPVLNLLLGD